MASGIPVHPDTIQRFNAMKNRKEHSHLILGIEDNYVKCLGSSEPYQQDKNAIVDESLSNQRFAEMVEEVRAFDDRPLYIFFDFSRVGSDGLIKQKLALILWCPDACTARARMVFASSTDAMTRTLGFSNKRFQLSEFPEFDFYGLGAIAIKA